ncbi:hypothetical protein QBC40DRAFT_266244 [Triangularia verruculosa]|uniref:LysM domain-containing protein n=1 Tax=Triangularia verruculosa TaxID=2587418 RepID=A0AAN7ATY2_9PEZI|nr:hypothetical protein QBC40DRAFT_266244 [Triangularia verruculosa]
MTLIRPGGGGRREEACCTCATLLSTISSRPLPPPDVSSEKAPADDGYGGGRKLRHQRLSCCARIICADCISDNPRFLTYCPYCQSSGRSSSSSSPNHTRSFAPGVVLLPDEEPQDDKPPPYTDLPPAYTSLPLPPVDKKISPIPPHEEEGQDILHFITPNDSIPSLSLLYHVPPHLLRSYNNLPSDHLLQARRAILIPAAHCRKGAVSLSPRPHEGEEEEARKGKIRRWMVATKEHDYDIAVTYLEGCGYDFEEALQRYRDDVQWEKDNPLQKSDVKKKGRARAIRGLVGGLLG